MQRARSILFDILLTVWTGLFAPALAVLWLLGSPERGVRMTSRLWARGILVSLKWLVGLTYAERGRSNIPDEPCLIIANHQSTWETLAFLILVPNVAIVAKQELLTIPVVSWFLRKSPMILIDREGGSKAIRKMIDESRAALAEGRSVLIFPEGTRKSVSQPVEFKRGVELLYTRLDRKVLPVALNSGLFWGPDRDYKRAGTISISYLDPIEPGLSGREFIRKAEHLLEIERKQSWSLAA
ncbi:1-acyl-sn-glycerol-3-phosphate acyltransferase [Microvirga sp. VF16]|uniref:lysophospholipid acyltransferase family protein n=1 Tax=Microvirga sp. VF16 TaxID=2807101 RepID=UPI00193E3059|nr:lysophospholipid acyltransferase family protein [Microvirga sp. VF16]QRM28490.1 1-acyl-sn-glycerol-3-phosphate acyltransferase [Microvirga sp. VF16]